jgi:hypothetical protein
LPRVGSIATQRLHRRLLLVDLRPLGARHHEAEVLEDLRHEVGRIVERMWFVRRHVGMVAEEGQVELLDGDDRAAHTLHAHVGQVDVEVAAEEPTGFGPHLRHLAFVEVTLAHVAVAPTEHDPLSNVNCCPSGDAGVANTSPALLRV